MNCVIGDIKEVTPAWLTNALSRNGYLEVGEVVGVGVTDAGETGGGASYAHLMVDYSEHHCHCPRTIAYQVQ